MIRTRCESLPQVSIIALHRKQAIPQQRSQLTITLGSGSYKVRLERSVMHFGGTRPWFKCHCGRRVGVLYQFSEGLRCRHCKRLVHSSARGYKHVTGLERKIAKLRAQVGTSKPKGMRWPTYRALLERLDAAERAYAAALLPGNGRKSQRELGGPRIKYA